MMSDPDQVSRGLVGLGLVLGVIGRFTQALDPTWEVGDHAWLAVASGCALYGATRPSWGLRLSAGLPLGVLIGLRVFTWLG